MVSPRGELAHLVSAQWLKGQAIALAASACAASGPSTSARPNMAYARLLFETLLQLERGVPGDHGAVRHRLLRSVPPVAMSRLADIARRTGAGFWGEYQSLLASVYADSCWREKDRRSPIAAAKLVADRLLGSMLPGSQIARLASMEFGFNKATTWRTSAELHAALGALNAALRRRRSTAGRLDAVLAIRRLEMTPPPQWHLVEAALLQRILGWIATAYDQSPRADAGHLLPVAIDVARAGSGNPIVVRGSDSQDLEESVADARQAAIDQWVNRFPYYPKDYREAVETMKVTVDVSLMNRIGEECILPSGEALQPEIRGRSAEAYLATAIFGRLIGSTSAEHAIATGSLTRCIPDAQGGGDWIVGDVGCDVAKYDAAEAQMFDRVVYPAHSQTSRRGRTPVLEAKSLSGYVDHVFGDAARKHHWIRCPDLAADFKLAREDLEPEQEAAIGDVAHALRMSEPVMELPGRNPRTVAWALYRAVETACRFGGLSRFRNGGSFVFVRAVEGEAAERFWFTVWHALGGDWTEFERFTWSASDSERGRLLAAQLQRYTPSLEDPRRSPDLVVLCGTKLLPPPRAHSGGPVARFDLDRVLRSASNYLAKGNVPKPSRLRMQLGKVRIVLVPEAGDDRPSTIQTVEPLDPELARHARDLSVFRWGFTLEMARRLLRTADGAPMDDWTCARVMERLATTRTCDGSFVLRRGHTDTRWAADGAFEYFLTAREPVPDNPAERAALHLRACDAIAGFVSRDDLASRFDYATAMSPVWLREAQHHAAQSRQSILRAPRPRQLAAYRARAAHTGKALDRAVRLTLAGEPFGFASLRWITHMGGALDESMLDEYLARLQRNGGGHPTHLALAASTAGELMRRAPTPEEGSSLLERAAAMLDEARRRANRLTEAPSKRLEGLSSTFVVEVERTMLLWHAGLGATPQFGRAVRAARKHLDFAVEILTPNWFSLVADLEPDQDAAKRLLRRGFFNPRIFGVDAMRLQAFVRWVGCHLPREIPANWSLLRPHLAEIDPVYLEHMKYSGPDLESARRRFEVGRLRLLRALDAHRGPRTRANASPSRGQQWAGRPKRNRAPRGGSARTAEHRPGL